MILEIIKDVLFAPTRLSVITSEKSFRKKLHVMQYPYFLIGVLLSGTILLFWIIVKLVKVIIHYLYILIDSQHYK